MLDQPPSMFQPLPGVTVHLDPADGVNVDPQTGAVTTKDEDGGATVEFNPQPKRTPLDKDNFYQNLALVLPQMELDRIAGELLPQIEADDRGRQEWLDTRAKGIDLLGFKLEEPRGDTGASTAPVEGMSVVRHPMLAEAVVRFQSNAIAELIPADGPVQVRDDRPTKPEGVTGTPLDAPAPGTGMPAPEPPVMPSETRDDLAEALQKDLNHYLLKTDRGYRADTYRMLFDVGFGGCGFKKVYMCPLKRRPVSRSVYAKDLIVSNAVADFDDAGRITQQIQMRPSILKRMQLAGVYRNVAIGRATPTPNAVERRIAEVQGLSVMPERPEDQPYTIYESYCELDIKGHEHEDEDGALTGLQLPYRVTLDKDSRQVLEIRRNWHQDDPNCTAKRAFVKFGFVPAFGFYEIGLLQLLGNADRAMTAAWRLLLDSGMFANFPGFLYLKSALGKQLTNEFRVPPGGAIGVESNATRISDAIMPMPYKDVGPGIMSLVQHIEQTMQRIGGTAEMPATEGRSEAPVGTTLALIEQATKILAAVHIGLHTSQSEEFELLANLFREDPESFWRHNPRPARQWEVDEFLRALDDYDLVPAADPNTPSHMHRIMKAVAMLQLTQAAPMLYDVKAVHKRILKVIGTDQIENLFAPPQAAPQGPPPDPVKMGQLQLDQQEMQRKAATDAIDNQLRISEQQSKERIAATQEQTEMYRLQAEQARANAQVNSQHQNDSALTQAQVEQARANAALALAKAEQTTGSTAMAGFQAAVDAIGEHAAQQREEEAHNAGLMGEFAAQQQQAEAHQGKQEREQEKHEAGLKAPPPAAKKKPAKKKP